MRPILITIYSIVFSSFLVNAQPSNFSYQVKREINSSLHRKVNFKNPRLGWCAELNQPPQNIPLPGRIEPESKAIVNRMRLENAISKNKKGYDKSATSEEVKPNISKEFKGALSLGTPNDNHCAVSNNGIIVSVINQMITAFDNDGNILMQSTLKDFTGDSLGKFNFPYDPRIIYDEQEDKFIFVYLEGTTSLFSKIVVAFSETNNPAGNWFVYILNGNPLNNQLWSDYPIIGISENDLFVSVNLLLNNVPWEEGETKGVIWQVDKKSGYTGSSNLSSNLFYDISYKDKSIRSICPVRGGLNPTSSEMYFLANRYLDIQNDTIFLMKVDNTQKSGKAKLAINIITSNIKYGMPPSALQPVEGYKLRTNDARILDAIYHDNTIQYVHNTLDMNTMTSGVYHGIIRNVIWPSVAYAQGNIISSDSVDYGYPSIAYAGVGDEHQSSLITCSHVSLTTHAGTSIFYYDGLGLYSHIVRVKDGVAVVDNPSLPDTMERWGDYTGIQRKYNEEGVFWITGSYGATNNRMDTWVAEIRNGDQRNFFVSVNNYNPRIGSVLTYPNPATNTFNSEIIFENKIKNVRFELYDMQGKLVDTLLYLDNVNKGKHIFSFNIETLSAGSYFLKVKSDGNNIHSEKLIVIR